MDVSMGMSIGMDSTRAGGGSVLTYTNTESDITSDMQAASSMSMTDPGGSLADYQVGWIHGWLAAAGRISFVFWQRCLPCLRM
jgi:hypothetical protein